MRIRFTLLLVLLAVMVVASLIVATSVHSTVRLPGQIAKGTPALSFQR